jgi:AcrR family transcriptional regulator
VPARDRRTSYHHGDLRAASIDAAIELIGERGIRSFSLAEVSRRLGVAPSAPYAHFSDRDELIAAVAVRAYEHFYAELAPAMDRATPTERLAAMARSYVRFAAAHRTLFEVLYEAGLDKDSYPELKAAEQPIADAFLGCVEALAEDSGDADALATAIEAAAHGHAALLLDGEFGPGNDAVELAGERAARATLALIESRHLLA